MEGVSLLPAMQRMPVAGQGPKYSMNLEKNSRFAAVTTGTIAVMADGYKYIRYLDHTRTAELYNLIDDPQEIKNLADTSPALVDKFEALVNARLGNQTGNTQFPLRGDTTPRAHWYNRALSCRPPPVWPAAFCFRLHAP